MDLLMPLIGCALGIVVSILSIKVVLDKGRDAIASAATHAVQKQLEKPGVQTALQVGTTVGAAAATGGASLAATAASTGIRMASNAGAAGASSGGVMSNAVSAIGQNKKVRGALNGAESFARASVGVAGVATAPLTFVAGATTKLTGKLSKFAGKKINGFVENLGEKRYKAINGEKEAKVDAFMEKKDKDLKKNENKNHEDIIQAAKNKRAAITEKNDLIKKKEELEEQKKKNPITRLQKDKEQLEEALKNEKDPKTKKEFEEDLKKVNAELNSKLKDGSAEKLKLDQLDKDIAKVNEDLNLADGKIDNADKELQNAQDRKKLLIRQRNNFNNDKKRLLDQRKIRHDEHMERYYKVGNAIEKVGSGVDNSLQFIGTKEMRMGLGGARQIGKVLTGKDFFTDRLFAPKGTLQKAIEATENGTQNEGNTQVQVTAQTVNNENAQIEAQAGTVNNENAQIEAPATNNENRTNGVVLQYNDFSVLSGPSMGSHAMYGPNEVMVQYSGLGSVAQGNYANTNAISTSQHSERAMQAVNELYKEKFGTQAYSQEEGRAMAQMLDRLQSQREIVKSDSIRRDVLSQQKPEQQKLEAISAELGGNSDAANARKNYIETRTETYVTQQTSGKSLSEEDIKRIKEQAQGVVEKDFEDRIKNEKGFRDEVFGQEKSAELESKFSEIDNEIERKISDAIASNRESLNVNYAIEHPDIAPGDVNNARIKEEMKQDLEKIMASQMAQQAQSHDSSETTNVSRRQEVIEEKVQVQQVSANSERTTEKVNSGNTNQENVNSGNVNQGKNNQENKPSGNIIIEGKNSGDKANKEIIIEGKNSGNKANKEIIIEGKNSGNKANKEIIIEGKNSGNKANKEIIIEGKNSRNKNQKI